MPSTCIFPETPDFRNCLRHIHQSKLYQKQGMPGITAYKYVPVKIGIFSQHIIFCIVLTEKRFLICTLPFPLCHEVDHKDVKMV